MIPPYDYASRPVPNASSVWMYGRMHFPRWTVRLVPKLASWPAKTWFFSQASRSVPIYTGRLKPKAAAEMKTPTCWNLDPAHPRVKKGEKGRDSRRLFHDKLRMSVQATSKKMPHHHFVQERLIATALRESKGLALENEKGVERTRSAAACRSAELARGNFCHHALLNCLVHCRLLQAKHCMRRVMRVKISWERCRDKRGGELAVEYSGKSKKIEACHRERAQYGRTKDLFFILFVSLFF